MKLKTCLFLLYLMVCVQLHVGGMGSPMNTTFNDINDNTTSLQRAVTNRTTLADSDGILSGDFFGYQDINLAVTGIYLPIIQTIGLIGNSFTVVHLHRGVLKSSASIYLLGLSISDLIYLATSIAWVFTAYRSIITNLTWKAFYSYYVSYVFPVIYTQFTTSIWIIVAFTVERLVVVAFPLKSKHTSSSKRPKIVVGVIYLFGICFNLPRYFVFTVVSKVDPVTDEVYLTPEITNFGRNSSITTTYYWLAFVFNIALPFLIIGSLNMAIVVKLASARRKAQSLNSTGNRDERDHQITRLLLAIVVAFFMCTSLSAALNVIVAAVGYRPYTITFRTLTLISNALLETNTVVNFILYATCSSAMRLALKDMLCKKRWEKSQN